MVGIITFIAIFVFLAVLFFAREYPDLRESLIKTLGLIIGSVFTIFALIIALAVPILCIVTALVLAKMFLFV